MVFICSSIMKKQTALNLRYKEKNVKKKWNRKWKLELIEKENPDWEDLYYSLV